MLRGMKRGLLLINTNNELIDSLYDHQGNRGSDLMDLFAPRSAPPHVVSVRGVRIEV